MPFQMTNVITRGRNPSRINELNKQSTSKKANKTRETRTAVHNSVLRGKWWPRQCQFELSAMILPRRSASADPDCHRRHVLRIPPVYSDIPCSLSSTYSGVDISVRPLLRLTDSIIIVVTPCCRLLTTQHQLNSARNFHCRATSQWLYATDVKNDCYELQVPRVYARTNTLDIMPWQTQKQQKAILVSNQKAAHIFNLKAIPDQKDISSIQATRKLAHAFVIYKINLGMQRLVVFLSSFCPHKVRMTTVCVQWLNKTNNWGHGRKEKTENRKKHAMPKTQQREERTGKRHKVWVLSVRKQCV